MPIFIPMSIRIRQFFALYPGASQPLEANGTADERSEFLTFQSQQETQLPEDDPRYVPSPEVASPDVVCVSQKPGGEKRQELKGPRGSIIVEKPQQPEGVSGGLTGQVDVQAQARVRKSVEAAEKKIPEAKAKGKAQAKKRQVPQKMQLPKGKLRVHPRRV